MCLSCRLAAYRREIKAARDKINEEGVEDEQTTLECHLSTEITEEALKECCGDNLTWGQWLSFAWSVVRAFGNLGLLIYTWLIIKPLQKDKAWDLEKHIVVFGEGLFSATILGVLIVQYFALVYHREDRKFFAKHLVISKEYISIGANFSFLKLLPLAQPEVAWKFMFQVSATARKDLLGKVEEEATGLLIKIGFYAYVILAMILLVSLALMSVSVKVSQLGFISHGMYWTPTHYLAFGLFVNALAGLRGDMEKQRLVSTLLGCGFKHFLFSPVCVEDSHFDSHVYTCLYIFRCCWSQPPTRFALLGGARAFHLKLVSQLLDLHQESRLKALIAFSTMTSEQCIALLKKEPKWGFWSFGATDSSRVKHGVSVFFLVSGTGTGKNSGWQRPGCRAFSTKYPLPWEKLETSTLRVDEWMLCGFQNLPLWLRKTWSWYGFLVLCGFIPRRFLRAGGHCSITKNSNFHGFTSWMRFHLKFAIDKDIQGYDWL